MPAPQRWWITTQLMRFVASKPGVWFYKNLVRHIDKPLLKWSGGRLNLALGQPVLLLTTTGAKTGQLRTQPLLYTADGADIILVASNFGQAKHPAWYYNLRKHPQAQIALAGESHTWQARELQGAEYERAWQLALQTYPGYANYQQNTTRTIPLLLLKKNSQPVGT